MEPADDLTLILRVLLEIRANVQAILELLEEEEDGDGQGDQEEGS